jgi:SPP1 gp7 family putative phage head morphogenesis protein
VDVAKLTAAQLAAVFGMKPAAAVAYLEQKGLRITGAWHDMLNEEHAAAFTVANAAQLDVLQDLRQAVLDALKNGSTERQFIKNLTPVLQAKGWWGKEEQTDANGEVKAVQLGSPRRLQTIYRTNMQSSYMAGRYHQMVQGAQSHPYWQYVAVMDSKTRPSHAAMNGRVFRWDDPVWQFLYPPNGFNCRCRVVALSAADVAVSNLTVESSAGRIVRKEVQVGVDDNGRPIMSDVTGIKLPTIGDKFVTLYTDAGFDVNQGAAATENAARIFTTKVGRADPDLGASAMTAARDWLLPQLTAEFRAWAEQVLTQGAATGQARAIGALTPDVLKGARAAGATPVTAVLSLADAELLNAMHLGAIDVGIMELPALLADPVAVVWDASEKSLIYVLDASGQSNAVAMRVDGLEGASSIQSIAPAALLDTTRYTLLQGSLKGSGA